MGSLCHIVLQYNVRAAQARKRLMIAVAEVSGNLSRVLDSFLRVDLIIYIRQGLSAGIFCEMIPDFF
jgi:hypothetical protein